MDSFNAALKDNITFVRPAYFIISGFVGIPNIKYYFVFLFFVYSLSFIGNVTVMTVLMLDHTLRSPKHIAVFNLALTDLLSSSALVPKVIDTFLFNHHFISYNNCLTYMFFCFVLISMQSLNLVALSIDRLMAILYPLHYQVKVTHRFMLSVIAFFWLFSVTETLTGVSLITRVSFCSSVVIKSYYCDHGPVYQLGCNDVTPNIAIGLLATTFILWMPLIFILFSYCCIIHALSKISTVQQRVKAFKTCTGHISLVALFYLPVLFVYLLRSKISINARIIGLSLSSVIPPTLNPIIYVFQTQEIKESLKKLLKVREKSKIRTKNEQT
ncbi:olfactory receptor 6C4-like [Salarias fasciatus]|uniref:olfactory receptor 6C4-like n=1 Tax=Salarias fasciatus TaxID=181472 RepID=UPI0011769FC5|nr:olfactory receptor 6C4-like [Salarias fasciatus]